MHYASNEKATQPMHLCGPISAFCYSQPFNDILWVVTENAGLILTPLKISIGMFLVINKEKSDLQHILRSPYKNNHM